MIDFKDVKDGDWYLVPAVFSKDHETLIEIRYAGSDNARVAPDKQCHFASIHYRDGTVCHTIIIYHDQLIHARKLTEQEIMLFKLGGHDSANI